jgi:hypothetical protein
MSSPLIMHRLQVPISRGDSAITSPAARGATLANSTFEAEGGKLQAPLSYEAVEFPTMPWACVRPLEHRMQSRRSLELEEQCL